MSDLQCPARLLVARHAEADYPRQQWSDDGGTLTELGRRQAAELAERLRPRRISHVYPSTMARAVQTAEIVADVLGIGVSPMSGLREFEVGSAAGEPLDSDPFAPTFARWLAGEHDLVLPGAESGATVVNRMRAALQEISDMHRGEAVLVISHGGIIRLALPVLVGYRCTPTGLDNCAVVDLEIDSDDWICHSWADGTAATC